MGLSTYIYLASLAVAAVALLVFVLRCVGDLTASAQKCKKEIPVLVAVLVIGVVAIYGPFLTEGAYYAFVDAGSDTVDQYVPFYVNLVERIQSGDLGFWNFDFGLGTTALSYQSWLLDPFNLILVPMTLMLGIAHLSVAIAFTQCVKIVLTGVLFNRLLLTYCKTPLARILGGCLYAFSGFLLLWGHHYWIGGVMVLFTALLVASEALFKGWSISRFAAMVAVCFVLVFWSPYCGFMVLLGTFFYALLRALYLIGLPEWAEVARLRAFFVLFVRLAVPIACGCLLAGVTFVPYAVYLFGETSRISSNELSTLGKLAIFATSSAPVDWAPMLASRFLGTSLIVTGTDLPGEFLTTVDLLPSKNYYEILALSYSAGGFVLMFQFFHWAFTELEKRAKVLVGVAIALVFAFCVNNLLPAVFNLLVMIGECRSSFVIAAPICIALALGWENRIQNGKVNMPAFAVSGVLTVAVLCWSLLNAISGKLPAAVCLACAVVILLLVFVAKRGASALVSVLLCFVLVASSVADGFFTTNRRAKCAQDMFPHAIQPDRSADTLAALDRLRQEDPSFYRVDKLYWDWNIYNDAMVEEYQGLASYNPSGDADIVMFFNLTWPEIMGWAFQYFPGDPDRPELTSLLGVKYVLSKEPVALKGFSFKEQVGTVYVYENDRAAVLSGHASVMAESAFEALPSADARRAVLVDAVVVPDQVALSHESGQGQATVTVKESSLRQNEDSVVIEAEASGDVVACLAIPFTTGWNVLVDGQKVDTFRADEGFIGFDLSEGSHQILASYAIPGLTMGIAMSVAGVVLLVASVLVGRSVSAKGRRSTKVVK